MFKIFLYATFFLFSTLVAGQHQDSSYHAESIDSLLTRINDLTSEGKYNEALEKAQQVKEYITQNMGTENVSFARGLNYQAQALEKLDQFEKADSIFNLAKDIVERTEGQDYPLFASILTNLGTIYGTQGDFESAEQYLLESNEIYKRVLGVENLDYIACVSNLGSLYMKMGQYKEAEPLLLEAIEIRGRLQGEDNQDFATNTNNLGVLYIYLGSYDKAEPLLKKVLSLRAKLLGKEHPSYSSSLNNLAALYYKLGKYDEVIPLFEESLIIDEKIYGKKHTKYALTINNLAQLYKTIGKAEEAEALFVEALSIYENNLGREHPSYLRTLQNLGLIYLEAGNYGKADSIYSEVLNISKKIFGTNHPRYASILNELGVMYLNKGEYDKVEPFFLEGLAIRENIQGTEHPDYATLLNNLGGYYWHTSNFEKAGATWKKAKEIISKTLGTGHPDYALILRNLSNTFKILGKFEEAEKMLFEALKVVEEVFGKEHVDYANTIEGLATIYEQTGEYAKSENLFIETLKLNEKIHGKEHRDYANVLLNLGNLYWLMGNFEKSEEFNLEAKEIYAIVLGLDHPEYARCINNLSASYLKLGNFEKTEYYLKEALTISEKIHGKFHNQYANYLNNLGNVYLNDGQNELALELLTETKEIWLKLGIQNQKYIATLNNLGLLYSNLGEYEKADSLYKESLLNAERIFGKNHPLYVSEFYQIANNSYRSKNYPQAATQIEDANEMNKILLQRAANHLSGLELQKYLLQFESEFNLLASINHSFNSSSISEQLYDNSLFLKGFLLSQNQRLEQLTHYAPDSIQDILYKWKSCHRRLSAQYSKPKTEQKDISELETKANNLEKEILKSLPSFENARRQVDWKEVQAQLKEGEAAIEFFNFQYVAKDPTDSIYYSALILKPEASAPNPVFLFEEKDLNDLIKNWGTRRADYVNSLYSLDTRGKIELGNEDRKSLYELIIQPLESALSDVHTIYFSPSGLLHRINLGAIPIGEDQNLGDKFQLHQLNSTRSMVIPSPNNTQNIDATLYGGIEYNTESPESIEKTDKVRGDDWNYIKGTEREVNNIEDIMRSNGLNIKMFTGSDATEEQFKAMGQEGNDSPKILHLATHGYFFEDPKLLKSNNLETEEVIFKVSDLPMLRSGLILAGANKTWGKDYNSINEEDGILTALEISQMNLRNTELVVLSACETGLGEIKGSEGVYGLQRAFKLAGVKYVLMSLWQVPDKQTSTLMQRFYENWLDQKLPIRDAFAAAQKEMWEMGFDPYYWAGFVLIE